MSGFKGTPGPWIVTEAHEEVSVAMGDAVDSPYEYTCGHLWQAVGVYCSEADEEDIANARLIAAAPELLDSAQLALSIAESWIHDQLDGTSYLEGAMQSLDPVRAAIRKALGKESDQ